MEKREKIEKVLQILEKHFKHKERTTLNRMRKSEPFKILISCLLSLRTKDENTEKVTKKLFSVASTPKEIAGMNIRKLEKLIYSSGHYHKKARTLKHVSSEILKRFNGKVPRTREELLNIKGIGPKTANIVLNFAFGECVIPVDTHCHRVPNRLGWIKTKTAEKSDIELNKIIPDKFKCEFNALFVLFGKEICTSLSPFCSRCPVYDYCERVGVERSR